MTQLLMFSHQPAPMRKSHSQGTLRQSDAPASLQSILQAGARFIISFLAIAPLISPVHAAGKLPAGFDAPRDEIIEKIKRVALLPFDISGQWPGAIAAASELAVQRIRQIFARSTVG